MSIRVGVCVLALAGLVALGAGLGFGEDEGKEEKPKAPMSEMEMWMKSMELAKPGPMHKHLDVMVGKWQIQGTAHTSMGSMPFQGATETAWVLGGRFLEVKYTGPGFGGGTMEGRTFVGYDNGKKEYQSVWLSTMNSGVTLSTGSYDEATKTFTYGGSAHMPDGNTYKTREVVVVESDTRIVVSSYSTGPDGKERKEVDMIYTKAVAEESD